MYLDLLILARLDHGPAHGYEIKKHVARLSGGTVELNNNVLYPALRRFQDTGAIERADPPARDPGNGARVPRQVYRLTDAGQDQFQALLDETGDQVVGDEAEFKARVAFFDRLEPAVRRQLLSGRRRVLEQSMATMEVFRAGSADRPWARRVIDFEIGRTRDELAWLDELHAGLGAAQSAGTQPAALPGRRATR